jgi:hypothetical protein
MELRRRIAPAESADVDNYWHNERGTRQYGRMSQNVCLIITFLSHLLSTLEWLSIQKDRSVKTVIGQLGQNV